MLIKKTFKLVYTGCEHG